MPRHRRSQFAAQAFDRSRRDGETLRGLPMPRADDGGQQCRHAHGDLRCPKCGEAWIDVHKLNGLVDLHNSEARSPASLFCKLNPTQVARCPGAGKSRIDADSYHLSRGLCEQCDCGLPITELVTANSHGHKPVLRCAAAGRRETIHRDEIRIWPPQGAVVSSDRLDCTDGDLSGGTLRSNAQNEKSGSLDHDHLFCLKEWRVYR